MIRVISVAIALTLLLSVFTACQKQNTQSTEPAKTVDPLEQKKSDLHNKVIEGNFNASAESEVSCLKWARMWFDDIYSDYGIEGVKVEYLSGAYYSELSEDFEICPRLYSIQFSSQKPIPGVQKNSSDQAMLKVFVVSVSENNSMTLSGFLGPGEFNEYDAVKEFYEVVSKDPRYSSRLKPFPTASLPKEFTEIDMNLVTGGHIGSSARITYLQNDIFAVTCSNPVDNTGKPALSVSLFDLKNKKAFGYTDLGEYLFLNSLVDHGRLALRTQKEGSKDSVVFYTDSNGNTTSEKYPADWDNILYSPDKSKYAYSSKGNLYVVDVNKDNKPKLMLKGNYSDNEESLNCYPFKWIDDSSLVYGIMGYEWSSGCGMIDTTAGRDTFFEQAGPNAQPYSLANGKLYTIVGAAGEPFDPGVLDLKDSKYSWRKVFKDRGFIESINAENSAGFAFSPDGTKIAIIKTAYDPNEKNALYICSSEDGSILKSYEFQTGFNRPQYLEFLEDGRIAVYSERYAYSPGYMYIVDPD